MFWEKDDLYIFKQKTWWYDNYNKLIINKLINYSILRYLQITYFTPTFLCFQALVVFCLGQS